MGNSPKESFVFGSLMCAGMVIGMTIYNLILILGFNYRVILGFLIGVWPAFLVAMLVEALLVGRFASWVAHRVAHPTESQAKHLVALRCAILGSMVLIMTLYGTIMHVGFSYYIKVAYLGHLWKNIVMALPLNLLVVAPLARLLFLKLYPQASIQLQPEA